MMGLASGVIASILLGVYLGLRYDHPLLGIILGGILAFMFLFQAAKGD